MPRRIYRATVSFDIDIDTAEETLDIKFSDEEAEEYALACFLDDMDSFLKYNELQDIVHVERVS